MKEITSTGEFDADVKHSDKPLLVDFYADWCVPCQSVRYLLDDFKDEITEGFILVKVNVDTEANAELLKRFYVNSIPTLVRVENGAETKRFIGLPSHKQFKELIG